MKTINTKLIASTLITVFTIGIIGTALNPSTAYAAQATINLKTAAPFAILSGTPGITESPTSVIKGDVGLYPGAGSGIVGLLCSQVTGTIYARDATGNICFAVNEPLLDQAKQDLTAAYIDAAGRTTLNVIDAELGGQTLVPGVYISNSTTFQLTAGAGPLVLNGQGDPAAVFIFQAPASEPGLIIGAGSEVSLTGSTSVCNVFWRVDSATIDTTAIFKGTIMALNSITVNNGANIEGRLLARNGQVTLINSTINAPVCAAVPATDETGTPKLPNTGIVSNVDDTALLAASVSTAAIVVTILGLLVKTKREI